MKKKMIIFCVVALSLSARASQTYLKTEIDEVRQQQADLFLKDFFDRNEQSLELAKKRSEMGPSAKLQSKIARLALKYQAKRSILSETKTCEDFFKVFVSEQMLGSFYGKHSRAVNVHHGYQPFVTRNERTNTIDNFGYSSANGFVFNGHWEYSKTSAKTDQWVVEILRPDPKPDDYAHKAVFQKFYFTREPGQSGDSDRCELKNIDLNVSRNFEASDRGLPRSSEDEVALSIDAESCKQSQQLASHILETIKKKRSIGKMGQFADNMIDQRLLYSLKFCRPSYSQFFAEEAPEEIEEPLSMYSTGSRGESSPSAQSAD